MNDITDIFFELLRVALGTQRLLSRQISADEWQRLYDMAEKQTLLGVAMAGVLKHNAQGEDCGVPTTLYWDWYGMAASIQQDNDDANRRCQRATKIIRDAGFETCILKGQGVARYYPDDDVAEMSLMRQTGDIDIWMWPKGDWTLSHDERVKRVAAFARQHGAKGEVCYHHIDMNPAKGFFLEAHFTPSWMYSPFRDRVLQRWFRQHAEQEMQNEFSSLPFNRLYMLIHIYRHLFREGIGLRQVVDYFFVLRKERMKDAERTELLQMLKALGVMRFTRALMWILHEKLGLEEAYLLLPPDEKEGKFLLSEIMLAGNFGHFDPRLKQGVKNGTAEKFWVLLKRNNHLLTHYPSEVLWAPLWKIWHQIWVRKF